ncbi:hypothetical protein C0J52_08674 [Blattella germanica]|nr:hypothetical protein C0J52_08674 [Blattella germanica]
MKNTMIKILSTPVIDLILKDNIHLLLRRNIIKMFNSVLSGSSLSLRSKITGSAILEFIFRYITIKNNREQYKECFSKYPEIQKAFVSIPFQDFDSDCRIFLNVVNSALSSEQNVFTFPSVKAFVDNREILKPKDENYKELWVDFNMNSHSIIIVCDGSSFIDACVNDWEIITIGCNFVKRAFFKQRNASEVAYSLIIEVGAQKSDAYMTMFPPTANKFEIVFQDTTAINCLIQKITNSVEIIQQPISNLNVSRESVVSSAGRGRKVSQAGIYPIKKSSYLSKYQPLNIMMSPRYPLPHRNTERKYLRTDILTISRDLTTRLEDCSQPQSVLSPDPNKVV